MRETAGMSCEMSLAFYVFSTVKTIADHSGYCFPVNPLHPLLPNNAAVHDVGVDVGATSRIDLDAMRCGGDGARAALELLLYCSFRQQSSNPQTAAAARCGVPQAHHDLRGFRKNFSQPFFVHWDKLMGTYLDPAELVRTAEVRTAGDVVSKKAN